MSTVEDSESLSTMATDGYRIYANVEFCDRLGEEELMGVLAHEVLHNVLGHIERRRREISSNGTLQSIMDQSSPAADGFPSTRSQVL